MNQELYPYYIEERNTGSLQIKKYTILVLWEVETGGSKGQNHPQLYRNSKSTMAIALITKKNHHL